MLYATFCVAGPRGPGCSLSARSLACSSPSTLSRRALTGAGQQTSTCRLTLEFLLPLTWPLLAHSDRKPLETSYAEVKRLHLDTAQICQTQGLRFIPLVVETTGAWEPEAAKVLHHISGAVTAREGAEVGASTPNCSRSFVWLPAASGQGPCSDGEQSWLRRLGPQGPKQRQLPCWQRLPRTLQSGAAVGWSQNHDHSWL